MNIPSLTEARLLQSEVLSRDIIRHTYSAPVIAKTAIPGQFCMVESGAELDPLLRRPFSIHAVTDDGNVQILFKVIGKGTRLLMEKNVGDAINIIGPLGQGFEVHGSSFCLVGGGMGIAPLLFLFQRLKGRDSLQDIKILLGARNIHEIRQLQEDFRECGAKNVHVVTDDGSMGRKGFVTELLKETIEIDKTRYSVLSCGPHPMLQKVAEICNEAKYPCQVSMETMMACGISACLGCAVTASDQTSRKYLHVCKDGPVFNAEYIDWRGK